MLNLTRREGESLKIGDSITVTILKIASGGQIRIGIQAPDSVEILREELLTKHANKIDLDESA